MRYIPLLAALALGLGACSTTATLPPAAKVTITDLTQGMLKGCSFVPSFETATLLLAANPDIATAETLVNLACAAVQKYNAGQVTATATATVAPTLGNVTITGSVVAAPVVPAPAAAPAK